MDSQLEQVEILTEVRPKIALVDRGYPRTDTFDKALPVFDFPKSKGLPLWVLPFCLHETPCVNPRLF